MLETIVFLLRITHAYKGFEIHPNTESTNGFYRKDFFIYDQILFKKLNLEDWFTYLKSNDYFLYLIWPHSNLPQVTDHVCVSHFPYLIAMNETSTNYYEIKASQSLEIGKNDSTVLLNLFDQMSSSSMYKPINILDLKANLLKELNVNLDFCEKALPKNLFAQKGVDMYTIALRILENDEVDLPDYICFSDGLTSVEKNVLSAISKIDIVSAMGSFRDLFSQGMSDKLYNLIISAYMRTINGDVTYP